MPDTLIFHYQPSTPDSVSSIIQNDQKQLSDALTLTLAELAEKAKDNKCIALLDSSVLNIVTVNLPTQNRQRQIQAIPFALEDQLASDIEDTHFALSKKQQGNELTVAAINKNTLDDIQQQFEQAGLFVDTLLPDVLALPYRDNGWTVLIDQNRVLIKMSADQGCYTDRDNLSTLLKILLSKASQPPQQLLLIHADDDIHAAELIEHSDMALSVETFETNALTDFCQQSASGSTTQYITGSYMHVKNRQTLSGNPGVQWRHWSASGWCCK